MGSKLATNHLSGEMLCSAKLKTRSGLAEKWNYVDKSIREFESKLVVVIVNCRSDSVYSLNYFFTVSTVSDVLVAF